MMMPYAWFDDRFVVSSLAFGVKERGSKLHSKWDGNGLERKWFKRVAHEASYPCQFSSVFS